MYRLDTRNWDYKFRASVYQANQAGSELQIISAARNTCIGCIAKIPRFRAAPSLSSLLRTLLTCLFLCFARNIASLPASMLGTLLLCLLLCSEHCFLLCSARNSLVGTLLLCSARNTASMLGTLLSCLIPLLYA